MGEKWTVERIPDQSGRTAIVTGSNSGIGFVTARELARRGASVVMACRNVERGEAAADEIRALAPGADVGVRHCDLASLESVRAFAEAFRADHDALDVLVNNAGVMAPPRTVTPDGFEVQIGSAHFGHFALTGFLIGLMEGRELARVVSISSMTARFAKIDFDDLQGERRYNRWRAYGQSKLATQLFAVELDRRLRRAGSTIASIAAHPGLAATNLQGTAPYLHERLFLTSGNVLRVAQSADMGALTLLYAATEPSAEGGSYVEPGGFGGGRGHPRPNPPLRAAADEDSGRRLWEVSEELTGVRYELAPATPA